MTSPLPPRLRDTRSLADRSRQDRTNLKQLGVGFVGGRFSPAKPLGATSQFGDLEDDAGEDAIGFLNTDRMVSTGTGNAAMPLTYLPIDGSEHVTWHPNGGGGIRLTPLDWYRDDQTLTIPAFDGLAAGDVLTCEYAYLLSEDAASIEPEVVGFTAPGTYNSGTETLSIAIPAGTVAGDLLVLVVRGGTTVSGGEGTTALSTSDARMTVAYTATSYTARVWTGIADGTGAPIVITITEPAGLYGAVGVLASIRGANGFGPAGSNESSIVVPRVTAVATVAASWVHSSFVTQDLAAPVGEYTNIGSTGIYYMAADLAFWFDQDATTSPAATYLGEGIAVIPLI